MSEEIAQAIGDIADRTRLQAKIDSIWHACVDQENEIARLTSTTIDLRAALAQQDDEIAAERRARQIAEADNAALLLIARRCATTMTWPQLIADSVALSAPHPGTAQLAELEAARAVVAAARSSGNYPTFALSAALVAYDAAVKASNT